MAEELRENKKIYWINEEGLKIPKKVIDKHIQKRDKLVEDVFLDIEEISKKLSKLKEEVSKKVTKFLEDSAAEYHEEWKGNTILLNFKKDLAIEVNINKTISLDERLQIAKSKIDNYVLTLVKDSQKDLVTLVTRAFNVDKKGNVNVKDILALRTYDIQNPEWLEAMNLITESISIDGTRTYYQFKKRNENGKWENVSLNFSAI